MAEQTREWQPIATAPLGVRVLLWWVGDNAPVAAHAAIIGVVTYYAPGSALTTQPVESLGPASYWDGETYHDLRWVKHWMPLPAPPSGEVDQ